MNLATALARLESAHVRLESANLRLESDFPAISAPEAMLLTIRPGATPGITRSPPAAAGQTGTTSARGDGVPRG